MKKQTVLVVLFALLLHAILFYFLDKTKAGNAFYTLIGGHPMKYANYLDESKNNNINHTSAWNSNCTRKLNYDFTLKKHVIGDMECK